MAIRYVDKSVEKSLSTGFNPVCPEPRRSDVRSSYAKTFEVEVKATGRKRGRPRLEDAHKTLAAEQPWQHTVPPMSRATWFRRQSEERGGK
jgi:hypothetical protein